MLPKGDDRKGIAALIIKMAKGSEDMEDMRHSNERSMEAKKKDGAEMDMMHGMDAAANSMMQAMKRDDIKAFRSALTSFIEMARMEEDEHEEEHMEA